jgi:hypothetical protein
MLRRGAAANDATSTPLWIAIAMTIALVLPPALVIGGIIGFLIRQSIGD